MKVFVISILCALAGYAAGGAVGWPGAVALSAPILKTIIPGETRATGYSTTQYINALPPSYPFAANPHFAYHVPQVNSFAPPSHGYYSFGNPSYIPATNFYYPTQTSFFPAYGSSSLGGAAVIPGFPSATSPPKPPAAGPANPGFPTQPPNAPPPPPPAGDSDSAVIDSADLPAQEQGSGFETSSSGLPAPPAPPAPTQPSGPQPAQPGLPPFPPANTFPNFQAIPQIPQFPQQPPQIPQNPQFPEFPQVPGAPQNEYQQGPSQSRPESFPAPTNDDRGLNDEDTISVESA